MPPAQLRALMRASANNFRATRKRFKKVTRTGTRRSPSRRQSTTAGVTRAAEAWSTSMTTACSTGAIGSSFEPGATPTTQLWQFAHRKGLGAT